MKVFILLIPAFFLNLISSNDETEVFKEKFNERKVQKSQNEEEDFKNWKKVQKKSYTTKEEEKNAADNYVMAKRKVEAFNKRTNESYKQDVQSYADQNPNELLKTKAGFKMNPENNGTTAKYTTKKPKHVGTISQRSTRKYIKNTSIKIPDKVNYTNEMLAAKDQLNCASCYIFASISLIEYESATKLKKRHNLSEQSVVDCIPFGCDGGWPGSALDYAKSQGLVDGSPGKYEYTGRKEMCNRRYYPTIRKIVKYCSKYLYGDENELKALVARGPVTVGVSLTINMLYYKSGIFYDPSCSKDVDHAITVVGYDTDEKGSDFWIIRNSWGVRWGQNGYGWFARNKNNSCGIANVAFYLC